jgi:hypothetical protein
VGEIRRQARAANKNGVPWNAMSSLVGFALTRVVTSWSGDKNIFCLKR